MARARSSGKKTTISPGKPRLASASREEAEERALMYLEAADFNLEEALLVAVSKPDVKAYRVLLRMRSIAT